MLPLTPPTHARLAPIREVPLKSLVGASDEPVTTQMAVGVRVSVFERSRINISRGQQKVALQQPTQIQPRRQAPVPVSVADDVQSTLLMSRPTAPAAVSTPGLPMEEGESVTDRVPALPRAQLQRPSATTSHRPTVVFDRAQLCREAAAGGALGPAVSLSTASAPTSLVSDVRRLLGPSEA